MTLALKTFRTAGELVEFANANNLDETHTLRITEKDHLWYLFYWV